MKPDVYKQLFEVMKNRRGPYTGIDIPEFYPLVQALFTPEEAALAARLPVRPAKLKTVAERVGMAPDALRPLLEPLCDKGLVMELATGIWVGRLLRAI